jgi:uncharacterized protein YoxC
VRNLIIVAVLVLVLMVTPTSTATSEQSGQVRLIDPSTSRKITNGEKLKNLTHETNQLTEEYNKLLREAKLWVNIDPEKLAPLARKIADNTEKIAQLLEHYFEVDP